MIMSSFSQSKYASMSLAPSPTKKDRRVAHCSITVRFRFSVSESSGSEGLVDEEKFWEKKLNLSLDIDLKKFRDSELSLQTDLLSLRRES